MKLNLDWLDARSVLISVGDKNEFLWDDVRGFFPGHEPHGSDSFIVTFHELIASWRDFFGHFSQCGVAFSVGEKLTEDVRKFRKSQEEANRNYSPEELATRLKNVGFIRELKDFQIENVCRLTRRNQGATFSVPGAGKTTEALAFFYATAEPDDILLVVSPINAFGAWDEQLVACTGNDRLSFVRLTGGAGNVEKILREKHRFLLTNYELLRSTQPRDWICRFLRQNSVYVFLDESHKIKNEKTTQADAVRLMQCYPKAKLIMSGTPMPQSARDLLSQYRFLFPDKQVSETDVIEKFKDVYVRTTATRLGITPIKWHRKNLPLDEIEQTIYRKMRVLELNNVGTPSNDAQFLRGLGKSVMRLMAFVSNPSLVAHHFAAILPELPQYLRSKDSKKIEYVCRRARELAAQHKKVLIWSSFVRNVELISSRLQDIGADYIHGGVKAGDVDDPTSREGKIRLFHERGDEHMVLVANPAAASEGISLHKACQYAIYLDRSFNAAHFLQSQDRIHRLGLPENTVPEIELVTCPNTIDDLVEDRLNQKINVMAQALNDASIIPSDPDLLFDGEEEYDLDVENTNSGITQADVESILRHLKAV